MILTCKKCKKKFENRASRNYCFACKPQKALLHLTPQERLAKEITDRLKHARKKHPVFAEGMWEAFGVIYAEIKEMEKEIDQANEARARDECLDVVATCIRFLNEEWKPCP